MSATRNTEAENLVLHGLFGAANIYNWDECFARWKDTTPEYYFPSRLVEAWRNSSNETEKAAFNLVALLRITDVITLF